MVTVEKSERDRLEAFDQGGVGHAAALAHGLEAVAAAGALKLVDQSGHQAGAAGAERVAEGDCAAVDIYFRKIGASLALPGDHYAGERLIDLDAIDVVDAQPGAVEHFARGGGWSRPPDH